MTSFLDSKISWCPVVKIDDQLTKNSYLVNENANVNENLPPSPPNGGIFGGPQSTGSWANIPVVPTMTNMIHNNLKSANPPPGATVQYVGTDRLGNSPAEMPGIYWYNPIQNHGLYSIKGVKNN